MSHTTVLAGGSGAAKFLLGLVDVVPEEEVHVVVNVGDDHELWGLYITPDIDSILYALAGELDPNRGWGRRDETFRCLETIKKLGMPSWFRVGDRDLATHLVRSDSLRQGLDLTQVTALLADRFGIGAVIMPVSDSPVRTRIQTPEASLTFQEYFVREKFSSEVRGVSYEGAEMARATTQVVDSIMNASRIVVAPSNPVTSIGAILAVPGIRDALARTQAAVVAISPVIGSQPVSGPAGILMQATGSDEVSARAVAERYRDFLDQIVIHTTDLPHLDAVRDSGVGVWVENILINSVDDATRLARRVTNEDRPLTRKRVQ
jgi:LPPG:FO 2-phospho-L-lactate transferase